MLFGDRQILAVGVFGLNDTADRARGSGALRLGGHGKQIVIYTLPRLVEILEPDAVLVEEVGRELGRVDIELLSDIAHAGQRRDMQLGGFECVVLIGACIAVREVKRVALCEGAGQFAGAVGEGHSDDRTIAGDGEVGRADRTGGHRHGQGLAGDGHDFLRFVGDGRLMLGGQAVQLGVEQAVGLFDGVGMEVVVGQVLCQQSQALERLGRFLGQRLSRQVVEGSPDARVDHGVDVQPLGRDQHRRRTCAGAVGALAAQDAGNRLGRLAVEARQDAFNRVQGVVACDGPCQRRADHAAKELSDVGRVGGWPKGDQHLCPWAIPAGADGVLASRTRICVLSWTSSGEIYGTR